MANPEPVPAEYRIHRLTDWSPRDSRHHHRFINDTVEYVEKHPKPLHPVLKEFQDAVEKSTRLSMLFQLMFKQIPYNKEYLKDAAGNSQVRDFGHLLRLLNHIISTAPIWTKGAVNVGLVGVPVTALLDWPMGTTAGFCVFQDPTVNEHLKKILDVWGEFLSSPESAHALSDNETGWFGPVGLPALEKIANVGKTSYTFEQFYKCDPSAKYYGFKSWDDFFTRSFREEVRPVASPDDDSVVANACESKVYKVGRNIHARDQFWIKGQPYSVLDVLSFDDYAKRFVGGTIYQAFLSPLSYHRWHSPVSGTIKRAYVVQGTYYSEPPFVGIEANQNADPHGERNSQEYLSATATRAIIFIDNPRIGVVAFVGIGMTEVSTCEITVKEGQQVKKGDDIGTFHFGGSTHCLLFEKGVNLEGFPEPSDENVPIRSKLCVAK
ncbi:phosphatidylserine decarboxylase [Cryptococcus gattii Ru294]|nr:phosphatidylserine decarboxylase [Cryptococcus gattii Ru294]